jgi:hypothetical protein
MERFWDVLRWCVDHWKSWGIPAKVVSTVTVGTFFLALLKKLKDWRQAKVVKRIDARVILALQDQGIWSQPRPFTGAGVLGVRSAEIAKALSLDNDVVIESLERLEAQGKIRRGEGTLNNPAPPWFIRPR